MPKGVASQSKHKRIKRAYKNNVRFAKPAVRKSLFKKGLVNHCLIVAQSQGQHLLLHIHGLHLYIKNPAIPLFGIDIKTHTSGLVVRIKGFLGLWI